MYENTKTTNKKKLIRNDLVYPELCYQIIGILFEVYKQLGDGYREKYYQKITEIEFKKNGIKYKREFAIPLIYKKEKIGNYFLDFLVEDKIVLELKRGERFSRKNIEQVYSYLKTNNLRLGIIANFTKKGVEFKRIVNLQK